MTALFRTSALGHPTNKNVEMLNYAPHPLIEDVLWLPTGGWLPVMAEALEYDASLPAAAHDAFRLCVQKLGLHPDLRPRPCEAPGDLIKALTAAICADTLLPAAYPGHHEADDRPGARRHAPYYGRGVPDARGTRRIVQGCRA